MENYIEPHWVLQYNSVQDVNLNEYTLDFLESEYEKYNVNDLYSNLIKSYQNTMHNSIVTLINGIIDNNIVKIEYNYNSFDGVLNDGINNYYIFKIQINKNGYIHTIDNIRFSLKMNFFNSDFPIDDLNESFLQLYKEIISCYEKLLENKGHILCYLENIVEIYNKSIRSINDYKNSEESLNRHIISKKISEIIKEKKFYNFINSAMKDFTLLERPWTTNPLYIKIIEITKSGKSIKYFSSDYENYIEIERVSKFRQRYDV